MQQQIQTKSNVDLESLGSKLARDLNLNLIRDDNFQNTRFQDIDLNLDNKTNLESLSITKNHSEKVMDYEQIIVDHHLDGDEKIIVTYFTSDIIYFKRMFSIGETENEFLAAIKNDYGKILERWPRNLNGGIHYQKRIANDQQTLEEIFYYATAKFSNSKASA